MSDNLEQLENDIADELEAEELDEVKASMGDPSEISDPVGTQTPKRKADKRTGTDDPMVKPKSKYGLMAAMMNHMKGLKKENLSAEYDRMLKSSYEEFEGEAGEEIVEDVETIDLTASVEELFGTEEISEEFKSKAALIFEAAVAQKVNEKVEAFVVEAAAEMEAEKEVMMEEMTEKVDNYLDYVVGTWMEENKLAVEKGIRDEMMEDFMVNLKNLFVEHYIEIPEDKVDVIEELASKVGALEEELKETTNRNVELNHKIKDMEKEDILSIVSEDLTDVEKEKLKVFSEAVEYKNKEDFTEKLSMLKEHYFKDEKGGHNKSVVLDEETDPYTEEEGDEKSMTPEMKRFYDAISRNTQK